MAIRPQLPGRRDPAHDLQLWSGEGGASHLEGGIVAASSAICAGVYDESFVFYADQCP